MNLNPTETANKVRKTAWGDRGFPVDPVTIARSFAMSVIQTELPDDVSGALIKEEGKDPVIVVHYADSDNRKRFTVAHELGHYISRTESKNMDESYDYIDFRDAHASKGVEEEEIFANQFAANLLMPLEEVHKLYKKKYSHLEMGQFFGVSADAIKYRLRSLGLI